MWLPLNDEIENTYRDTISGAAYSFAHNIAEDFKKDYESNKCTTVIKVWIPIILSTIRLEGANIVNSTINIYKSDFGADRLIFSKAYTVSDPIKTIDIPLMPGQYAIEGLYFSPIINCLPLDDHNKNNRFLSIQSSGPLAFTSFFTNYGGNASGFSSIQFRYRLIDTYLGIQEDDIHPMELIPHAWYFLKKSGGIIPKIWDGTDMLSLI